MNHERAIAAIEAEWSADHGFFHRLRQGEFDPEDHRRVMQKLAAISIADDASLPRRLVSVLWFIPLFMEWQMDRVRAHGGDANAFKRAMSETTSEIERLLGVP